MPETSPSHSPFRFGVFELDPKAGELRKRGLRVRLQDQPFRVLLLLVQHPGELVTREEIQNTLWRADTFVDFDHGLNKAISKIREALNDSAESPRFVETVARRGYRFLAEVKAEAGAGVIGDSAAETAVAAGSASSAASAGTGDAAEVGASSPARVAED
jgi:DNA-binding winged helix-turn-helix (wHTH) protein